MLDQRGVVLWLMGLYGFVKTTTPNQVAAQLNSLSFKTAVWIAI
jgi:adenylylsulfate kinase-like enzyme